MQERAGKFTRREVLQTRWKDSNKEPEELAAHAIEPPWQVRYLWKWWQALSLTREKGMGVSSITYTEMQSWAWLTGRRLQNWEVEALCHIDNLFVQMQSRQSDGDSKRKK